jgi:hypothetical protein
MSPFLSLAKSCCHVRTEESERASDDASDGTAASAGRVTDELVNTYARNNPDAPELDFDDCTGLTDEALWAISSSRAKDCCIEKLSIRNCKAITDKGLLALADSKVKIGEIDTRGVEQLTLVAVTRLLFDCGAKMLDNLPTQLEKKVEEILGDKDSQSAVGKACLFLAAQPTVSAFTVPYIEGTTSEEVSMMLCSPPSRPWRISPSEGLILTEATAISLSTWRCQELSTRWDTRAIGPLQRTILAFCSLFQHSARS